MTLNNSAADIAEEMKRNARGLNIDVHSLKNGSTVLDCGVKAKGSIEAGKLFSEACLGGLADISISEGVYGKTRLPVISVWTDKPYLACIGSQKAGWKVKVGDFFALGSGPARMLLEKAKEPYLEKSKVGVLALETSSLPNEDVSTYIAEKCGIDEKDLTLLATRTASISGSTQVSARMVETALFKMDHLGIKVNVTRASGSAPIAPVIGDDNRMMGVENDMIIYGSTVYLEADDEIDVEAIPSVKSRDYGVPFQEVFKRYGYDFFKIDQGIFAPAEIRVKNKRTGEIKSFGKIKHEIIEKTLGIS